MKFTGDTVSKPVSGREAKKLRQALKQGSHVTNQAAEATISRIIARATKASSGNAHV